MDIKKNSSAGTLESNDCFVTLKIKPNGGTTVQLKSSVYKQFGEHIIGLVERVLDQANLDHVSVVINDRGALDYTLKARLATAIERACE